MEVNYKKSVCLRIGFRFNYECSPVITCDGHILNWVQQFRYLGVFIDSASLFRCDFSDRKKAFYRSFNSIFGRVGRNASPEVIIELVKKKCLSLLLYASEVLPFSSSGYKSLDYVFNCAIRKVFSISSNDAVAYCREIFSISPVRDIISDRHNVFLFRLAKLDMLLGVVWS